MLNGFINLNKSKGMTSSAAVTKVKYILAAAGLKPEKIGHLGTLDPDGEGVLPIALGRGTRLFDYFLVKNKVYYAEFVFGSTTDTLDASGKTVAENGFIPSVTKLKEVIPSLLGRVNQLPPDYSAKVVGGKRAYKLAREGKEIDLMPKAVDIYSIDLLSDMEDGGVSFRIECGGGTYIRSIARDMAAAAGSLGYMRYIKRLRSGVFDIDNSYTLGQLAEAGIADKIIPLETICGVFPRFDLPEHLSEKVYNGVKVAVGGMPDNDFALYISGDLAGIACRDNEGKLNFKTRLI